MPSPPSRRRWFGPIVPLASLLAVCASTACSSRPATGGAEAKAEPIPQCEAFLSAYEHCLDALGPSDIARARVEQTRAALTTQLSGGTAARAALREKCADNLSQLRTTCR